MRARRGGLPAWGGPRVTPPPGAVKSGGEVAVAGWPGVGRRGGVMLWPSASVSWCARGGCPCGGAAREAAAARRRPGAVSRRRAAAVVRAPRSHGGLRRPPWLRRRPARERNRVDHHRPDGAARHGGAEATAAPARAGRRGRALMPVGASWAGPSWRGDPGDPGGPVGQGVSRGSGSSPVRSARGGRAGGPVRVGRRRIVRTGAAGGRWAGVPVPVGRWGRGCHRQGVPSCRGEQPPAARGRVKA
ncbi:hypothetical protein BJY54_002999 [Streptomyces nodosus]|nr:hypothetical protein [Streptomyces nodosus]